MCQCFDIYVRLGLFLGNIRKYMHTYQPALKCVHFFKMLPKIVVLLKNIWDESLALKLT